MAKDTGGYARVCDMEPGMTFRERSNREPLTWAGIDPVSSGRPTKREFVRILTVEGPSWICDKFERFPLVSSERRG